GPRVREALHLVRDMVEQGEALIVIGNHEFNAITYSRMDAEGEYLRPHTGRYTRQLAETLEQFANYPQEWREFLGWFATLPLYLEMPGRKDFSRFRVVHACWDSQLIEWHREIYGSGRFDDAFIEASVVPGTLAARTKQ